MSHDLTDFQIYEAKTKLGIKKVKTLPQNLQKIWGNINPEGKLPKDILVEIVNWIEENSNEKDYVLVQGDFGATYYIVDYCFKKNRIPIYATSKRDVEEKVIGNKVVTNRVFKHVNFRRYEKFKD
ncbi:hypothetical protein BET03_03935 [Thermohalobacter berrensis]|uniref:Uncharacterized protein n=2 Tax=Thermohalobacter berrensis TaxID=99594 RepID=A0A419T1F5_9FIRM|nr:hypothetical protein BET03_03935 [Thermohalobacter berrensis]